MRAGVRAGVRVCGCAGARVCGCCAVCGCAGVRVCHPVNIMFSLEPSWLPHGRHAAWYVAIMASLSPARREPTEEPSHAPDVTRREQKGADRDVFFSRGLVDSAHKGLPLRCPGGLTSQHSDACSRDSFCVPGATVCVRRPGSRRMARGKSPEKPMTSKTQPGGEGSAACPTSLVLLRSRQSRVHGTFLPGHQEAVAGVPGE